MAFACEHTDRSHYTNGLCQNCYLAEYYVKKKQKLDEQATSEASEQL